MKKMMLLLVSLLITAMTMTGFADVKSIALVSGTDKGTNVVLPAPFNTTVFAGTFKATIDGNNTRLYCIDLGHYLVYNEPYQDVQSTDSLMTYVLNNYYPFKAYPYTNALGTVEKEAAAVQLVLWKLADGLDLNALSNVELKTRALAIYADAATNAHTISLHSFFVDVPAQSFAIGSPITFTVKAFDNLGIAMPNVNIVLSTTAGTLSTTTTATGPTGVSPVITLTPGPGVTNAVISVSGTVGIPAGTKYFHVANPNGKQKLILATPTIAHRTITHSITWFNQIQLAVYKTADKSVVNNGDFINYTIVVKNTGSTNAQNVEVSDQLATILNYVSSTPAGVYNPATGIWTVGALAAGDSSVLTIKTKVNYGSASVNPFNLGAATDFNFFVIDTLIQPSADTEGKLAVGGYADLRGYSVGDKLPPHSGDVLVSGNHLTFITGRVYNGRAVYQNYITTTMGFSADDGIVKDSVINFPAAKLHLENLSAQLATLAQTDTVAAQYMALILNGHKNDLNVFYLDGNMLKNSNDVRINAPAGSTVLVNVSGTDTKLFGGFEVTGTTKDKVFLNFYEAKKLHISGVDVKASVLAPKAVLDFPAGIVTGQLIVRCMYGSGQINLSPFTGNITRDTSIANLATIVSANQANMPSFFMNPTPGKSIITATPSGVTGTKSESSLQKPASFKLEQNYPNPFNPSTKVRFAVPQTGFAKVTIYNLSGEMVAVLADGTFEPGTHEVTFDAGNLPSGIYLCRMTSGTFSAVQKMILQK